MSPHAFVDESARGDTYLLCAVLVDARRLDEVRQMARRLCLPGQRRWHFKSESDRRRRQIIDAITRGGAIEARLFTGKGPEVPAQTECLTALVFDLLEQKAGRLIIESQASQDSRDQRCIIRALQERGQQLDYAHLWAHQDPGLWLPDAVAWAYGAGGQWRRRVEPVIKLVHQVADVR